MSCDHEFSDIDPGGCLRCGIVPGPEWLYGECGGCRLQLNLYELVNGLCTSCGHRFPPEEYR